MEEYSTEYSSIKGTGQNMQCKMQDMENYIVTLATDGDKQLEEHTNSFTNLLSRIKIILLNHFQNQLDINILIIIPS
jgi:hypothetical protein